MGSVNDPNIVLDNNDAIQESLLEEQHDIAEEKRSVAPQKKFPRWWLDIVLPTGECFDKLVLTRS